MSINAYQCVERGGVVWAYMGPADKRPAPPEVEWCGLPAENVFVTKRIQECNYLQAMEGGIDTAHVSYVHRYEVDTDPMHRGCKALDYIKADGHVEFSIEKILPDSRCWSPYGQHRHLLLAADTVVVPLVYADSTVHRRKQAGRRLRCRR